MPIIPGGSIGAPGSAIPGGSIGAPGSAIPGGSIGAPGSAIGVVGSDGYTPSYNPAGLWAIWSVHEIYMGGIGLNKHIPKVNDYVIEPESGTVSIVTTLSNITYIPTLVPRDLNPQPVSNEIILSSTNDNYRVYFDKSVTPWTLSVDGMLRVYSSTASFARIYEGLFMDPAKIVSRVYDNSNAFIGHDIPLQLVLFNLSNNFAIKSVPTCNTTTTIIDGNVYTLVIFDSNSRVLSKVSCMAEETTFVSTAYAEQKYITEIFLKSAFINNSNPTIINYPVNLPITALNPIGVVQYNDGTQMEHPVTGGKFSLFGLDQFVSNILGYQVPLVLNYKLGPDEATISGVSNNGVYVTRPYTLNVSPVNTSYNVKLYVYPEWHGAINGYGYKVYLMNLDRRILFDVTNKVNLAPSSPVFLPLTYGVTQRLTFTIDLATVSGIFSTFIHVQAVDITLKAAPTSVAINNIWEVSTNAVNTIYGTNLKVTLDPVTNTKLYIGNNLASVAEFIATVYMPTIPLIDPLFEVAPIVPTHIEIMYLNNTIILPIDQYATEITFNTVVQLYSNVNIVFLKSTVSGYLKLSVASMTVR